MPDGYQEDPLDAHKRDEYAHGALIGRIMRESAGIREAFDRRVRSLENRLAAVAVIGALGLMVLGAVAYAVAARLVGH